MRKTQVAHIYVKILFLSESALLTLWRRATKQTSNGCGTNEEMILQDFLEILKRTLQNFWKIFPSYHIHSDRMSLITSWTNDCILMSDRQTLISPNVWNISESNGPSASNSVLSINNYSIDKWNNDILTKFNNGRRC